MPALTLIAGPLIEANLGDRLLITVRNFMPNATAIHWHGQPQNGTNFMVCEALRAKAVADTPPGWHGGHHAVPDCARPLLYV